MKAYNVLLLSLFVFFYLSACTKKQGTNLNLSYSDKALFDSCLLAAPNYYLNNSSIIYPGNNGAHGSYKLRLNAIALKALTDNGKLPLQATMPEGSLIVKEIIQNNRVFQYALMYKKSNTWLWAKYQANKTIIFSVNKNPQLCTDCHNQNGNRDFLLTFKYY